MFDFSHPFYKPLWRRVLITGFCFAWALFELWVGAPVWATIFAAMGAITGYAFFIAWSDDDNDPA